MKAFLFVTPEGYTYQPHSESPELDIENLQVLGSAKGENEESAFKVLMEENSWLASTSFDRVFSIEILHEDFERRAQSFHIHDTAPL